VLLYGAGAQFTRNGEASYPQALPLAIEAMTATACPSPDPGEALLCRLREAADPDAIWRELRSKVDSPLAGWVAIALAQRPPPAPQAEEIAALLDRRESCNVRALALRAWPTLPAAQSAVRSSCYRLQAAGAAAFVRLGRPLPPDAVLPSFLQGIPVPDDTH
jgi:hypothetical protein